MSQMIMRSVALLAGVACHVSAWAAEKQFAAPQAAERAPSADAGGLLQVTFSLLLVLAAVFAAGWVVRKMRGFTGMRPGAIEVIGAVTLGTKERAVLVQVGKQQLLLGVAPGRVNTLHVLDEPITADELKVGVPVSAGEGDAQRPDFKAILKRSVGL